MKHWRQEIDPIKSKHCKACGLYLNQLPLLSSHTKKTDIFWVGLSAVQIDDNEEFKIPLSPSTRTGKLIESIEKKCVSNTFFYKTNLVKCLPLNESKIRYPQIKEMDKCFPNLVNELNILKPKVVFLLGKQVASFVLKKFEQTIDSFESDFIYETYIIDNTLFVPIHHPSYILVYRRKKIENYIDGVLKVIEEVNHIEETILV